MQENRIARLIDGTPFSRFHVSLLIWAGLTQFVEGFEMQLLGYTAPVMFATLHVSKFAFGWLFAGNNLGFMAGTLALSMLGDRIGRKKMIVCGVLLFGVCTLAVGHSSTYTQVLLFRTLSGIGLGGVVPNVIAITAEYSPAKRKATALSLLFVAYTLGSACSGIAASFFLASRGWRFLFELGGIGAILLGLGLIFQLPESIRFLAKSRNPERMMRILRRFDPAFVAPGPEELAFDRRPANTSARRLFTEGRMRVTLALWAAGICSMVSLHLLTSWLPTLIHQSGVIAGTAALVGSMFHVGGTLANLTFGRAIDRFGARVVAIPLLIAAPVVACLGLIHGSLVTLMILVGATGFFVAGGQNGLNALSGLLYPDHIRATGSGWAYGVGRLGSIIGPVVGGLLIGLDMPNSQLFLLIGLPMIGASAAVLFLGMSPSLRADASNGPTVLRKKLLDHK